MNSIFRLCAALCLVAGVSMFGVACGDDNGSGGGGDDCPSGQISATVNGEEGCYEECSADTECSAAGATCQSGVCVGGSGGGNNSNPDAGSNNDNDTGGGGNCGQDEVEVDLGDGPTCYATCTDDSECTAPEECLTLNDNTTQICAEFPSGNASCKDVFTCIYSCPEGDAQCQNNCYVSGTSDAQGQFDALSTCLNDNCANSQDPNCAQDSCGAELDTCAGCSGNASVDLSAGLGLECLASCTADGDCSNNQTCQDGTYIDGDATYCASDLTGLGDSCAGDGDCPASDVPQGTGLCLTEADADVPNGMCLAGPCQLGPNNSISYGPSTGCGLEALCLPQTQQGQTYGICLPLCETVDDCRSTDQDQWTCSIFQKLEAGDLVGTCEPACTADADCTRGDSTPNDPSDDVQGRCNTNSGYCEWPCDRCDQAGGTCDNDNFCVFE